jgi:hypothetical protein
MRGKQLTLHDSVDQILPIPGFGRPFGAFNIDTGTGGVHNDSPIPHDLEGKFNLDEFATTKLTITI